MFNSTSTFSSALFENAALVYSLRKIVNAYAGDAIRVRESGGNTEADIGFDDFGNLDTTALLAHTGANDGFVTTLDEQSRNLDNATQATNAAQPKVVSAGVVLTKNGRPTIRYDGAQELKITTGPTLLTGPRSFYFVESELGVHLFHLT